MARRKPGIEDLKGSSSLYQDPECVVLLSGTDGRLEVDVVKNKGEMVSESFGFNYKTGKIDLADDGFDGF